MDGCPSYLFHLPRKPWNIACAPDTLSGMHKFIEIALTIFREIFVGRAALHTEIGGVRAIFLEAGDGTS